MGKLFNPYEEGGLNMISLEDIMLFGISLEDMMFIKQFGIIFVLNISDSHMGDPREMANN